MPNRLAQATSPYLLQHADNPVDWRPWGEEAFAEARRRNVPVLLSVGYSSCHWCHVMAHESFEDEATAAFVNEHFVAVKVDREERPDVDAVYMEATVAMNDGQGGWPMTVFCTPEGEPFFCGTYFPPAPRHGMYSFTQVCAAMARMWQEGPDDLRERAARVTAVLGEPRNLHTDGGPPEAGELHGALMRLSRDYDDKRGGFGGAPKFPPAMVIEFLLRHHARTGSPAALQMAEGTCVAMARGGLYDQLGGGFARYSVDASWVVPHFEKMLYDNALLLRAYTHLWRATGSDFARRVALETADFLMREMRTPEGGFASALDADSEDAEGRSVEGAFYVWTPDELCDVLGPVDGAWAATVFGVTETGTFEHGRSVLQLPEGGPGDDPENAERLAGIRGRLLAARAERPRPGRDDKVVAAWNGLAITALAEAGTLFARPDLVDAALAAADLLVSVHLGADEDDELGDRLVRTSRDGRPGTSAAVLEDYADVAEGFLALYSVTGDDAWLVFAGVLLDVVLAHFTDEDGALYDTADDAEELFRRPQDPSDGVTPSGWTATAGALLTYAAFTGSAEHREAAGTALGIVRALGGRAPRAIGWGLAVAEAWVDGPREIAVVGARDDDATWELYLTALMATAPGAVVALGDPAEEAAVPLLRDRPLVDGRPAAYVCRHFTCAAPVTSAEALAGEVGARATAVRED